MQSFLGKYSIINQPLATDIVSLASIKNRIGIPTLETSFDEELTEYLTSGVSQFMRYAQMGILNTSMKCKLYGFSNRYSHYDSGISKQFFLSRQSINSITSIKYYKNNILTTLASDKYFVDYGNYTTMIYSTETNGFPSDYDKLNNNISKADVVEVEFITGFGDASKVPSEIKQALHAYVLYYYNNKGDYNEESANANSKQFVNLIAEYRYPISY